MSLLVRAARPLPIKMLAGEYERILRRRMTNVGGSPDDPAVQSVVDAFRWAMPQPFGGLMLMLGQGCRYTCSHI